MQPMILEEHWLLYIDQKLEGEYRTRAYDSNSSCFTLENTTIQFPFALDVEIYQTTPPEHLFLQSSFSTSRAFFTSWTIAEVIAKLNEMPILYFIKKYGFPEVIENNWREVFPKTFVKTFYLKEHVISIGYLSV